MKKSIKYVELNTVGLRKLKKVEKQINSLFQDLLKEVPSDNYELYSVRSRLESVLAASKKLLTENKINIRR